MYLNHGHTYLKTLTLLAILLLMPLLGGCGEEKKEVDPTTKSSKAASDKTTVSDISVNSPSTSEEASMEDILARSQAIDGMSYEVEAHMYDGDILQSKMWIEGKKFRMEAQNEAGIVLSDDIDSYVYEYLPSEKTADKRLVYQQNTNADSPKQEINRIKDEELNKVGNQIIDGKNCTIYKVDSKDPKKLWIWDKYGIALRVETQYEAGKNVMEYKNVQIGDIDDSLFYLPADTQVTLLDPGN